jgi:hypothetical protein
MATGDAVLKVDLGLSGYFWVFASTSIPFEVSTLLDQNTTAEEASIGWLEEFEEPLLLPVHTRYFLVSVYLEIQDDNCLPYLILHRRNTNVFP